MFKQEMITRIQHELDIYFWVALDRFQCAVKGIFGYACELLGQLFWGIAPYRYPMNIVCFLSRLRVSAIEKSRRNKAGLNCAFALKRKVRHNHHLLWVKKRCLEQALYFKNKWLLEELHSCAQKLQSRVDVIRQAGTPLILAPMHFHSDVLSALICSALTPYTMVAVSMHEDQSIGRREIEKLVLAKVNVTVLNPAQMGAAVFPTVLREIRKNKVNFLLFPDALPEITWRLAQRGMRTYECLMFGRKARLHSGVPEIARITGSSVLFFCLCEKNGKLDIDIPDALPANQVEQKMASTVEACIVKHANAWLLWHSPSLFYFNSAGR